MQTFDTQIKHVTFSFIRVTYGKGDLWYHISYEKDDRRITFRMTTDTTAAWKVIDTKDPFLLEVEDHLDECIKNFENNLQTLPSRVDIINATAKMIK